MSKNLVIVESPAKAKTIQKYLGKEFEVLASYGHVRDLVPKEGAVDPDRNFAMKYQIIEKNERHVESIAKAVRKVDSLYLATDPDREGEAISWHLYDLLKERELLDDKPVHRVVFYEITKRAINEAIQHPRQLSMDLVNAQQARRALDYLVGFNLSPLLWKKIKRGLSAGRVQSPALRMIVEREEEIERFQTREYWTIDASAETEGQPFGARLTEYQGEKVEQFSFTTQEQAQSVETTLLDAAAGKLDVVKVEKKQRKRNPAPPFTTSTLQQEASRKLGFSASRTMRIAQQLYEGIDIGEGAVGLITYMRTDSVSLATDAIDEIRQLIQQRYGANNLPQKAPTYKTKSKNAQEAHEAIRPTSASVIPDDIRARLSIEQYKLYDLIWKRTVACQMIPATLHTVAVDLRAGANNTFRATGSTIADPGFIAVYREDQDDPTESDEGRILPPLKEGDQVILQSIQSKQHFTEPPPRFTEASLVKTLEEYGIGRPSTYATIISTLMAREYVILEKRRFEPTDIGRIVNRFLTQHFLQYVDYDFTARMEDELDAVSRGEEEWVPLLSQFWQPFKARVDEKTENVTREEAVQSRELGTDPRTGRIVTVRMGRFGPVVQMGTKDDEEKPKFAGLRPEQRMDTITLEEALSLFNLPRTLGETPEGEEVSTNIGRFGPYVRYGSKFVSLQEGDDPYTISLQRALELVAEHKVKAANKVIQSFEGTDIQILRGRFGPYITDGKKNVKVPKDKEPEQIDLSECEALLAAAPEKKTQRKTGTRRASSGSRSKRSNA
ncbi:MAG: DNA topoisomerase I [Gammaproteobacteria bacterium]